MGTTSDPEQKVQRLEPGAGEDSEAPEKIEEDIMKQYLTKEEAAEDISVSKREIANIIAGIRENMGPGKRYGQYSLRGSGRLTQIRYAVLTDYMRYKDYFSDSVLAEKIPQFNVREAERDLGVVSDSFRDPAAQIDADMIAEAIIKAFALKMAQ